MQAQNDLQISYADLSAALGYSERRSFQLAEPDEPMSPPPTDEATLIQEALRSRPELINQGFDVSSGKSYATAERDLSLLTISAVGAAGLTPVHQAELLLAMRRLDSTSTFRYSMVISMPRFEAKRTRRHERRRRISGRSKLKL
jgi:outer membrane protein TolC